MIVVYYLVSYCPYNNFVAVNRAVNGKGLCS